MDNSLELPTYPPDNNNSSNSNLEIIMSYKPKGMTGEVICTVELELPIRRVCWIAILKSADLRVGTFCF